MASIHWLELPFPLATPGQILAAGIALPLVCISCVLLRFYVRRLQKAAPGADDWLVAIGVVFVAGMGACLITGERLKVFGYPTPVPAGTDATEAYGLFLDAFILQAKAIMVATSTLWSVGFLIALIFGCGKSVELHWAPFQTIEESGCDVSTPEVAMVISDMVLDLAILILPIPAIWKLNMSKGRKFAVTGIFLFGLMSVAASAARMSIYLIVLYEGYSAGYDINRE
ncbi:hypothetical protein PFICI_06319 [Pestalotiopsis fici W106-1]|uniref:Rhodopsin domain-containing protein n=1 Tax=Pestalotiopsis fici (strain W106-1 / CGMCC3.15140) TaxID=1229662 RepID=W3X7G0_PESFW|nr:uncharacterized protein PFICI_06319 [Pestalotiopsis fici W106-1]ETS81317.1 hypothetical protein PFICI_06319 [Pestalotiopsis fici W106-1]